jgi:hypothetical protein
MAIIPEAMRGRLWARAARQEFPRVVPIDFVVYRPDLLGYVERCISLTDVDVGEQARRVIGLRRKEPAVGLAGKKATDALVACGLFAQHLEKLDAIDSVGDGIRMAARMRLTELEKHGLDGIITAMMREKGTMRQIAAVMCRLTDMNVLAAANMVGAANLIVATLKRMKDAGESDLPLERVTVAPHIDGWLAISTVDVPESSSSNGDV